MPESRSLGRDRRVQMTDRTDLESAPVTVVHGSDTNTYNLSGRTISSARSLLDEHVFAGQLAGLVVLLNGLRPEDAVRGLDTELQEGDVLTFMARAGRKG